MYDTKEEQDAMGLYGLSTLNHNLDLFVAGITAVSMQTEMQMAKPSTVCVPVDGTNRWYW